MDTQAYIEASIIDEENFTLQLDAQMDRSDYTKVDEVLKRLGGKWNGKQKKHFFPINPKPLIAAYLKTGNLPEKNPTAFFPTPRELVNTMFRVSDFDYVHDYDKERQNKIKVLEPSAGVGGIADIILDIAPEVDLDVVEILEINQNLLREKGYEPICLDFMEYNKDYSEKYDYVLMNPPFSLKGDPKAYITHINHAYNMLKPMGTLTAIIPTGFLSNSTKKEEDFLEQVALMGEVYENPANSFKESGTAVDTVIVVLDKELAWREKSYQGYENYYAWLACLQINNDQKYAERFYKIPLEDGFNDNRRAILKDFLHSSIVKMREEKVYIPLTYLSLYVDHFIYLSEEIRIENGLDNKEIPKCANEISYTQDVLDTFAQGSLF